MKTNKELNKFIKIIKKLRAPGGCPWDRKQTHRSLRPYVLEETYEVLDAIDRGQVGSLKEELGDLLLQIMLHAEIASERGDFDIEDIAKGISEKMIRRHPHVFGSVKVKNADHVLKNWVLIKNQEKTEKQGKIPQIFDGIPKTLPALFENFKISKRVARLGFDWKKPADVFKKVSEELQEVKAAVRQKNKKNIEEELGDLLFSASNLCRVYNINPEFALKAANKKFKNRFASMEKAIAKQGLEPNALSFEKWDLLWKQAKRKRR